MRIYKSSRGSSSNISVQCISLAQPHSIKYEYLFFHRKNQAWFCAVKRNMQLSPHLNESFKCVLTPEGTGERGLKPWSIFLHSGLHLKDMTVRPISSKKNCQKQTLQSCCLVGYQSKLWAERILMCTNFHQECRALWSWDENPKQLVGNHNNRKKN